MDDHLTGILSNIGVISFVALSAYLLLLTGEISFGQQAFFAIGAYTAGIVTAMWQLPFWLGLGAAERHRGFPRYPLYLRARRQRDAVHADHLRIARGDAVWIFPARAVAAWRRLSHDRAGWSARRRTGRPGVPRKTDGGLPCRRDRRPRRRALCASHDLCRARHLRRD